MVASRRNRIKDKKADELLRTRTWVFFIVVILSLYIFTFLSLTDVRESQLGALPWVKSHAVDKQTYMCTVSLYKLFAVKQRKRLCIKVSRRDHHLEARSSLITKYHLFWRTQCIIELWLYFIKQIVKFISYHLTSLISMLIKNIFIWKKKIFSKLNRTKSTSCGT